MAKVIIWLEFVTLTHIDVSPNTRHTIYALINDLLESGNLSNLFSHEETQPQDREGRGSPGLYQALHDRRTLSHRLGGCEVHQGNRNPRDDGLQEYQALQRAR